MTTKLGAMALAVLVAACAGESPPPAVPSPRHATPGASPRTLSEGDCESLAQYILAACHDRGNDRATRTEGWCSDVAQHTSPDDQTWIRDCSRHVTDVDDACFRSTNHVSNLMDCDAAVSR